MADEGTGFLTATSGDVWGEETTHSVTQSLWRHLQGWVWAQRESSGDRPGAAGLGSHPGRETGGKEQLWSLRAPCALGPRPPSRSLFAGGRGQGAGAACVLATGLGALLESADVPSALTAACATVPEGGLHVLGGGAAVPEPPTVFAVLR